MRPILLLLAVIMIAAVIVHFDNRRLTAAANSAAIVVVEPVAVPGAPAQRDPRLARIVACEPPAMALAEDIRPGWWDLLDNHQTEDGLPDAVLLARAEAGNVHAMTVAGFGFMLSRDADDNRQHEDEGMAWIQRAAEAGDPAAQNELGFAYAGGYNGRELDHQQARMWLEKAIRGGDSLAGYTLATLYLEGGLASPEGETATPAELALIADLVAAQRCYADSIDRIADRLSHGRLLPRDLVAAGFLRRKTHAFRTSRN